MTLAGSILLPAMPRSARDPSPRASMTGHDVQVPPAVVAFFPIVVCSAQAPQHPRRDLSKFPPSHR